VIQVPENTVIYCKQNGEPSVPVTARIEWLQDGKIRPLMYWTPDCICYRIIHVSECVLSAFLKDGGVGLRYRIKSEAIETPVIGDELKNAQHETYLYLADNRFCGNNIIDSRYGHTCKEFIPVILDVFPDGDYELIYFKAQGARYMVEKTIAIEPRGSFHAGGVGIWHKVDARLVNEDNDEDPDQNMSIRRPAALYFEINKWFVSTLKS